MNTIDFNITNTRRTEIKTPDVVIHVDPDRAALIETQIIDGRKCIVIPMEGDVEINGIHVTGSFSSVLVCKLLFFCLP